MFNHTKRVLKSEAPVKDAVRTADYILDRKALHTEAMLRERELFNLPTPE